VLKKIHIAAILLVSSLICAQLFAQTLGAKNAKVGGIAYLNLDGEPDSLHPITASDGYSRQVLDYTFSSLGHTRLDTYELEPELAEKWEVSKDSLTFTFYLRQGLKFHDGKPITPEDVKFSFDAVFMPELKAFGKRPYFENIESATVVAPNKIVFKAKTKYHFDLKFEVKLSKKI
jgi:peptide/nickel transport system substrate-binding protein/microcin C transport system substrate-binding protein